jgi:hypothetical protein
MSDPKVDARARLRHDLRTPLHQIIGYAELLDDEMRDSGQEKYVADLAKIRDAARKALEFVDQVVPPAPSAAAAPPARPAVFRDSPTAACRRRSPRRSRRPRVRRRDRSSRARSASSSWTTTS